MSSPILFARARLAVFWQENSPHRAEETEQDHWCLFFFILFLIVIVGCCWWNFARHNEWCGSRRRRRTHRKLRCSPKSCSDPCSSAADVCTAPPDSCAADSCPPCPPKNRCGNLVCLNNLLTQEAQFQFLDANQVALTILQAIPASSNNQVKVPRTAAFITFKTSGSVIGVYPLGARSFSLKLVNSSPTVTMLSENVCAVIL